MAAIPPTFVPTTFEDLLPMSDEQLGRYDIALKNLLCGVGLPGKLQPDIPLCIRRIDEMAAASRMKTSRAMFDRHPEHWDNSWGIYRVWVMFSTLGRDFGVRYNTKKIPIDVPLDAPDSFLHGIIQGEGGTCASLPVLYAAVGRRLGYPIKLVSAVVDNGWGHCFARWDEPGGERFNIDVGGQGLDTPPDAHYLMKPYVTYPEWEQTGTILKSKTPREELAGFLSQRSCRWGQVGDRRREAETLAWASALAPTNLIYRGILEAKIHLWNKHLEGQKPPGFPRIFIDGYERKYPPTLPFNVEWSIVTLRHTEFLLKDEENNRHWWEPMRRDPASRRLGLIHISCRPNRQYTVRFVEGNGKQPSPGGAHV